MQLLIFKYEEANHLSDFTTVEIDGEIWFVASEICRQLDIQNVTQALLALEDDEKLPYVIHRSGQNRNVNLINESGLYSLIFRSKKPSAKRFRKWVTKEVLPAIRKTGVYGIDRQVVSNFVIRYNENWKRVDKGYFSVISQLYVELYGRFEHEGYIIPDRALNGKEIRPDVSVGKCFAHYLDVHFPQACDRYKMYRHKFSNGVEVDARQYDLDLLPIFKRFFDDVWMPNNAESYFMDRDRKALEYLPKLLRYV